MKKSHAILLTPLFVLAIASCKQKEEEWIYGGHEDTVVHGSQYRHYNGFWYPVYNNMISPSVYRGSSAGQIATPGYVPARVSGGGNAHGVRSGGFGSSAAHGGGGE